MFKSGRGDSFGFISLFCSLRQVFEDIGNFNVFQTVRHSIKYLYSTLGLKHVLFPAGEGITVQFPLQEYAIHAAKLLGI